MSYVTTPLLALAAAIAIYAAVGVIHASWWYERERAALEAGGKPSWETPDEVTAIFSGVFWPAVILVGLAVRAFRRPVGGLVRLGCRLAQPRPRLPRLPRARVHR